MSVQVETPDDKLNRAIREDVCQTFTPDMPTLRYRGKSVKVFLWDNLRVTSDFKNIFNQPTIGKDFTKDHMPYFTVQDFLPMYDVGSNKVDPIYPAVCLEDTLDMMYLDLPDALKDAQAARIMGNVYTVSLDLLTDLDYYYENEIGHTRTEIEVRKGALTTTEQVFVYMSDVDNVSTYDVHANNYKINSDMELTPLDQKTMFTVNTYVF